ncbi:MAG: hypothetical protein NC402_06435 [Prevotella sp.]|nr:hypothetical protein [Prevotella sp.]MCM1075338.1 hypothetical protein [Ruminococcus sp.]
MKKLIYMVAAVIYATAMLPGCKPTEKNYKLAYYKAMNKQRQGITEDQYDMMLAESLPRYMHTPTDSIRAFTEAIIWQYTPAAVDSGRKADPAPYNLAIGKYSMLTNAKAHADRLAADGWKSYVLRNGEPVYYVIVKMSDNLDTVARAAHKYRESYPNGTISLHEPMAIIPLSRR